MSDLLLLHSLNAPYKRDGVDDFDQIVTFSFPFINIYIIYINMIYYISISNRYIIYDI